MVDWGGRVNQCVKKYLASWKPHFLDIYLSRDSMIRGLAGAGVVIKINGPKQHIRPLFMYLYIRFRRYDNPAGSGRENNVKFSLNNSVKYY